MDDYQKGNSLIKKYSHFPQHIIGDTDINKHKIKIGDLLQDSNGIILKTQRQRLGFTNNLVRYFYRFGLKEIGIGKIKDTNTKNNEEIINIIFVLEKIGKLRF